jgi:peptidyl-prolyl cis-trans isomerase C
MMKNKRNIFFWAISAFGLVLWAGGAMVIAEQKGSESRVALVNGETISQADFEWEMHRAKQVYGRGRPLDETQLMDIQKRALENLIDRELLFQESKKRGFKVEPATVDEQFNAMKGRFPDEETFNKEIGKLNITAEILKSQLERAIATQQFVEKEIVTGITVSEKEIKDYYENNKTEMMQPEQVRASHVLIKTNPGATQAEKDNAKKDMEQIVARIKKGEDFATIAKEKSQCPSSAQGGDLGFFGRGQMVKPFETAAFALKPGEVSDIVETGFGYHVIKVVDKRPESIIAFDDVKEQLERHLKQQKVNQTIGQYVEKLKGEAKIERFLPQPTEAKQ